MTHHSSETVIADVKTAWESQLNHLIKWSKVDQVSPTKVSEIETVCSIWQLDPSSCIALSLRAVQPIRLITSSPVQQRARV